MKNKVNTIIFIILLTVIISNIFPVYAHADTNLQVMTDNKSYHVDLLRKETYQTVACTTTPSNLFVKDLMEKKTIKRESIEFTPSKEATIKIINEAAEKSGLVEYGVYQEYKSPEELYEYVCTNDLFIRTDNYRELEKGDIVFYKDCSGIVIGNKTILFADDNNRLVSIEIDSLDNMEAFTVSYPYYEKLANTYMKDVLKYHTAKRCGILTNMIAESNINPAAEENTSYRGFGVCQWTGERNDKLIKYCEDNNLNLYSIYSQLKFMDYELKNDFAGLNISLNNYTSPDRDGAYEAAFDFCTSYENPLSSDSAVDRGVMASDLMWPLYWQQ